MQDEVKPALAAEKFTADFDVIAFRRLRAEVGADPTIDRDPAFSNQLVAMPPRTNPSGGEKTVQAHAATVAARSVGGEHGVQQSGDCGTGAQRLSVRLGFREADDLRAFLELAALF